MNNSNWEKIDKQLCAHELLVRYTKAQRKSLENSKSIEDAETKEYQKIRRNFVNNLTDALKIGPLILQNLYKGTGTTYAEQTGEAYENDGFFKYMVSTDEQFKTLPAREDRNLRYYFDGDAYMTAVSNCISRYDPEYISLSGKTSSFLGLFSTEYRNCLNKIRNDEAQLLFKIPNSAWKKITVITRFLQREYPQYDIKNISYNILSNIAVECKIPEKSVPKLLHLTYIANTDPISLESSDDDTERGPISTIIDQNSNTEETFEKGLEIYLIIQKISSISLKSYSKLLMNNIILYPIHPQPGIPYPRNQDKNYKNAIIKNKESLKINIFDFGYLYFLEWHQPDGKEGNPHDITVLCYGYPQKPLISKTIAEYKKVSPATLTYYNHKFKDVIKNILDLN